LEESGLDEIEEKSQDFRGGTEKMHENPSFRVAFVLTETHKSRSTCSVASTTQRTYCVSISGGRSVKADQRTYRSLYCESCETHKYTPWTKFRVPNVVVCTRSTIVVIVI
jgi:hypothetical protein